MLTATYSIVAISTEQNVARKLLTALQQTICSTWKNLQDIDLATVENSINKLVQFHRFFESRKLQRLVIPAIRNATHEVDALLAELEILRGQCSNVLRSLPQQARAAFEQGVARQREFRRILDQYCNSLQLMLSREEMELLPLVPQILSNEEIFEIGAKFLAEDAQKLKKKQVRRR